MINYQQAKNILKKAKIKIQDEEISIKSSLLLIEELRILLDSSELINFSKFFNFEIIVIFVMNLLF